MKFNMKNVVRGVAITLTAITGAKAGYEGGYYDNGYTAATQNSTIVTERRVTTVASEAQANMVLSQISERLDSHTTPTGTSFSLLPQSGGNAGASDHRGSVWARAGIDHMDESNITSLGGWNANLWTLAIGYDHKINDKVLLGAALTYSNLNGSTKFNNGNMRDNAYGLVPYVAFKVSPCFSIDAMVGYSRVNKKRDRGTAASNTDNALSGTKATSSPKSDRYFAALYGNFKQHVNRWNLLARLGYMYATDRQKSYNETNGNRNLNTGAYSTRNYSGITNSVNRASLRLQAGYKASPTVEPYAFLTYALDFGATKIKVPDTLVTALGNTDTSYVSPNKRRSNNTFGGGLGLNANLGNNWGSSIEGSYMQSKKFRNIGGWLRVSKKF
jgi:hypothetical protein